VKSIISGKMTSWKTQRGIVGGEGTQTGPKIGAGESLQDGWVSEGSFTICP